MQGYALVFSGIDIPAPFFPLHEDVGADDEDDGSDDEDDDELTPKGGRNNDRPHRRRNDRREVNKKVEAWNLFLTGKGPEEPKFCIN
jgi:hypothetical protein